MVNTKLLPPAHFPTKEALRLWLLKHIEHPSIRRALEKGWLHRRNVNIPPTILVTCISPLGGTYYLNVLFLPNGLKIKSVSPGLFRKQMQQWFPPNRRSEEQGPKNSPDPDPDISTDN